MEEINIRPAPPINRLGTGYVGCITESQVDASYAKALRDAGLSRETFRELLRQHFFISEPAHLRDLDYIKLMDVILPALTKNRMLEPTLHGDPAVPLPVPELKEAQFERDQSKMEGVGCIGHFERVTLNRRFSDLGFTRKQIIQVLEHYMGVSEIRFVRQGQYKDLLYRVIPRLF